MMEKIRFLLRNIVPVCCKCVFAYVLVLLGYGRSYNRMWIVSERGTDARDNGFFFFQYLKVNQPQVKCCYVITKNSADRQKVSSLGEVVDYGSLKHYALLFRAECLISSHIMGYTPAPEAFLILERKRLLVLPGKKVFLQHGIIKADIEGLKYPFIKPDVFICGAQAEYDFVRKCFGHPEGVVQYTGLARYDTLQNEDQQTQILLMPTWRKWLNALSSEQFMQSDYYHAYSKLLSDPMVHDWLRERGLRIVFYPHYEMQKFIESFALLQCDVIEIAHFRDTDVQELLKRSSLLITDYSSVYFDFAFLGKPIIYYQFDQQRFISEHYKKGYFDESTFGEKAQNYEALRDKLFLSYDGNGFMNAYQQRQAQFFGGLEKGCCDKIYRVIMQLFGE